MQNTITSRQMVLMLFVMLSTSSVATIAKTVALSAKQGAWLTILLTAIVFGVLAVVMVKLNKSFDGKTLFEYSRELTGNLPGTAICLFYLVYFFVFSVFYCNSFTSLVQAHFLLKSPAWGLLIAGMPVYSLIAYKGIRNAARLAEIVGVLFFLVSVILFVSMLIQGTIGYGFPLFDISDIGKYLSATKDTAEPFLGIELLLLIPFMKKVEKTNKKEKMVFLGIIGIALFYIIDVYGCYAMIGIDEIVYHNFPLVDAIRLVEYPSIEFLQRLDIIYDTIGFIRVFVGKSLVILAIVELLCKLFPNAKRLLLVIITSVAVMVASLMTLHIPDMLKVFATALSYAGIASAFLIPVVLTLIARVKKNAQKNG